MNQLWGGMIVVGILYATARGNLSAVTEAALLSSKEAVTLAIAMLGIMSLWTGLMEIATKAGIIKVLSKGMEPLFTWIFPRIPLGSKAQEYITINMVANFLGLGWAATPAGLQAMEELVHIQHPNERRRGWASNEMCTFLIVNISSLQLIPINIIAYRSQYGSINPSGIVGGAIAATTVSTLAGILFCKWKCRGEK